MLTFHWKSQFLEHKALSTASLAALGSAHWKHPF
jgi:hypothetical protein